MVGRGSASPLQAGGGDGNAERGRCRRHPGVIRHERFERVSKFEDGRHVDRIQRPKRSVEFCSEVEEVVVKLDQIDAFDRDSGAAPECEPSFGLVEQSCAPVAFSTASI